MREGNIYGRGFSLTEILVVVGIIGLLGSIVVFSLSRATGKARDVKRKAEVTAMGRLLSTTCYIPSAGAGEYDILDVAVELQGKYPQYGDLVKRVPRDPLRGTETETFYRYEVTADAKECVVYANLENGNEPVTLGDLTEPTPGGGVGVLEAGSSGWNGTRKYFQVSN